MNDPSSKGNAYFDTGLPGNDPLPRQDYVRTETPDPHLQRARDILRDHPEVKKLFGHDPRTAIWGVGIVFAQLALAWYFQSFSIGWIIGASYLIGAVLNHSLWVLIHECTHNLVFKRTQHNKLFSIFLNFPQVVPSATGFSKFHMLHHAHQGDYELDGDLAHKPEADLVENSTWKKLLYVLFFSFIQGTVRPASLKTVKVMDRWFALNIVVQLSFTAAFFYLTGIWALLYLGLSTFFALGLHPLGGRWFSEHYLVEEHQETNSYYGPLNKLAFNVGYHNEHHDLIRVPWSRLPEVKKMAPEYYEGLFSYQSWVKTLTRFVFDSKASLFDRVIRPGHRERIRARKEQEKESPI